MFYHTNSNTNMMYYISNGYSYTIAQCIYMLSVIRVSVYRIFLNIYCYPLIIEQISPFLTSAAIGIYTNKNRFVVTARVQMSNTFYDLLALFIYLSNPISPLTPLKQSYFRKYLIKEDMCLLN